MLVSDKTIVEDAPLKVSPVTVEKFQTVPVPNNVIVEVPKVIDLVNELELANVDEVML